jgi:restriction endonuclease Mrr
MAPADFTKLAVHVLEELGFEIKGVAEAVSDGSEYFIAVNPEPIKGGKFVVECWARPIGSLVDSPRVLALIDSVKAEGAAKGLYLTPFEFSQEAQTAAATGPIDLLDGAALVKLVQKKLPDRLVER